MLFLSVVLILPISTININYNFVLLVSITSALDEVDLITLHILTPPDNVSFRPPGFSDFKSFDNFKFSLLDNLEINYFIFIILLTVCYYYFTQIF